MPRQDVYPFLADFVTLKLFWIYILPSQWDESHLVTNIDILLVVKIQYYKWRETLNLCP